MNPNLVDQTKDRVFSSLGEYSVSNLSNQKSTWPYRIFKFFASLKLAIFVLVSLMITFAAGTFIESYHGTEAASLVVYQSPWMALLLFFLGVNVAAAAIDRWPWQKKHIGFVTTHVGIIIVLIGSFVTKTWVVDAQMSIAEGETEHRITLPDPVLYVFSEENHREWALPLKKDPFPWNGKKEIHPASGVKPPPFEITLLAYYPQGQLYEKIVSSFEGPAALQVTLHNSFVNETSWLIQNHPSRANVQVGPAKMRFAEELLPDTQARVSGSGYLEFKFDKTSQRIPLETPSKLPAKFPLENTEYSITILQVFKNAAVVENRLAEQPEDQDAAKNNPAVQLLLEGKGISEKHTAFAKFPDFPTQHGMKPSQTGAKIFYRLSGSGSRGETHELRFVKKEDELWYQIVDGFEVRSGKVEIGKDISTGWMDLQFKVDVYYPHSEFLRNFSPEANTAKGPNIFPAIQIEVKDQKQQETLWLGQGLRNTLNWNGQPIHFVYGEKRVPLGFRLKLRDFRIEHYPGTTSPASFESDVTLIDDSRGVHRDVTISMNNPLIYQGFYIYQSAYSLAPGQPEISIFSVGKDPGIPFKYLGAIVIVAGMLIMFYTRKFSTLKATI